MGQRSCRNFSNYVDDVIVNQKYKIRTSINVRMTSGLPESVCLSSIRDPTYPMFEGGPLKSQKPLLQKCIFQYEDLTKLTVVQIYDTIHFFSGNLLIY